MSLMEHIRELRNRLIKAALGLAVGMVIGWFLFKPAWNFITSPVLPDPDPAATSAATPRGIRSIVTGIFDPFFLRLKVAFVVGLVLSSPVWLYQIWAFIAPGLLPARAALDVRLRGHRGAAVRRSAACSPTSRWAAACTSCSA